MKAFSFEGQENYIQQFLDFPKKLYSQKEIMQSRQEEEQLLRGEHYLNRYITLTPFLVMEDDRVLARCAITEYPQDLMCYFGFFECVEDESVFACLMAAVERTAQDKQYTKIEGPLDASLWIRYRFKANRFEDAPYLGEPYNKPYYLPFFKKRGYGVKENYVSNLYRALPREEFALAAYEERWESFINKGYEIRSPRPSEWDKSIGEIYDMIAVLYRSFLTYHDITKEEFVSAYDGYRGIVDYDMIKMLYYKGKAVGFFMGAPDFGNLSSRKKTPSVLLRFLRTKHRPRRYVLLYMGVLPEHHGAGMALTHSIMTELAKKGVPSIGSLIRRNNPNYNYAQEYMTGRYEYQYLEKQFSIGEYLSRGEALWEKEPYIAEPVGDSWQWHTFGEFVKDVRKCAQWLMKRGEIGKNIGLFGDNSYAWMTADISIMGYVGVCFPIDRQYQVNELRHVLQSAQLSLMLYGKEKEAIVAEVKREFPHTAFVCFEEASQEYAHYCDGADLPSADVQKVVNVLYTSGTAAVPKGVMLTQANLFANWKTLFRRTPMTQKDSIYLVLPLNHVYAGVAAFLYTLISGMKIYLGTPQPERCLADFEKLHPSVFIGVPLLAEKMWDIAKSRENPAAAYGGNLAYFYCGGAAIRPELKKAYIAAGLPFIEAYGLTETSSVVALDIVGEYRDGSTGVLMESVEAVIDEPDDAGIGELLVRGGSRMAGYYQLPEVTREVIDSKGFFHTGDLARIDDSRHLYIVGRKREMLVTSNGKNVYPEEVERLLCGHAGICRATLYKQEDRLHVKVWYEGNEAEAEAWVKQTRENLPHYMQYDSYECIEDLAGRRLK